MSLVLQGQWHLKEISQSHCTESGSSILGLTDPMTWVVLIRMRSCTQVCTSGSWIQPASTIRVLADVLFNCHGYVTWPQTRSVTSAEGVKLKRVADVLIPGKLIKACPLTIGMETYCWNLYEANIEDEYYLDWILCTILDWLQENDSWDGSSAFSAGSAVQYQYQCDVWSLWTGLNHHPLEKSILELT